MRPGKKRAPDCDWTPADSIVDNSHATAKKTTLLLPMPMNADAAAAAAAAAAVDSVI